MEDQKDLFQRLHKDLFHEQRLANAVRMFPCLYDKSHKLYKDRSTRQQAWNEVSKQMGFCSEADAEAHWVNLRTRFTRQRKIANNLESMRRRGDGERKSQHSLDIYHLLSWLDEFVLSRKRLSTVERQEIAKIQSVGQKIEGSEESQEEIGSQGQYEGHQDAADSMDEERVTQVSVSSRLISCPSSPRAQDISSRQVKDITSLGAQEIMACSASGVGTKRKQTLSPQVMRSASSPGNETVTPRRVGLSPGELDATSRSVEGMSSLGAQPDNPTIFRGVSSSAFSRTTSFSPNEDHFGVQRPRASSLLNREYSKPQSNSEHIPIMNTYLHSNSLGASFRPEVKDENDIFGELIASQLKKLSEYHRLQAKHQIEDLMYKIQIKEMNMSPQ